MERDDNLKVFRGSDIHRHGDEVLKVSLEKLGLHLRACFGDGSAEGSLPEELVKLTLCLACPQTPR